MISNETHKYYPSNMTMIPDNITDINLVMLGFCNNKIYGEIIGNVGHVIIG